MNFLGFIWNPSQFLFEVDLGFTQFALRYYTLMFLIAFSLGYFLMKRIFINEKKPLERLESLFIYVAVPTLVGARLGHCFFYDWDYFQHHILEIFLPFQFQPEFKIVGFSGLASHGAAVGIVISMFLYNRKFPEISLSWLFDRIVIPITIGGMFVRFGNFFNSEINGKITDENSLFAVKFLQGGDLHPFEAMKVTGEKSANLAFEMIEKNPQFIEVLNSIPYRYPAQIFEAIGYFFLFWVLMYFYWKTEKRRQPFFIFGIFLVCLWGIRFFVEFVKESQGGWLEENLGIFSTGQWLSLPFILVGFYLLFRKSFLK